MSSHNKLLKTLIEGFLVEAEDLLASIEQAALALDSGANKPDTINELFRAFHTIKGSSGMCGLDRVAGFTHHLENLLVKIRDGALPVTPALIDLVLRSKDHIKALLDAENGGSAPSSAESLVAAIEAYAAGGQAAGGHSAAEDSPLTDHPASPVMPTEPTGQTWNIQFRPSLSLMACGTNPASLLNELRELGQCKVTPHLDDIPDLDAIVPENCYLWWTIQLTGACDLNAIRNVFIFVEGDSTIEIEPVKADDLVKRVEPVEPVKTDEPAQPALVHQAVQAAAEPPGAHPVSTRQATAISKEASKESSVRVPSSRLDHLVNLVGELVINQSRLAQAASQSGSSEMSNPIQELERLASDLRDSVLGIRMLPIGNLFGRFRRLVHDLSTDLGKEVDLVTEGDDTELDKSILDQLGDPLVHCLRNSLDHGVEPPEERVAKGKPRRATVRLSAVHRGSDVVVSIQDDGRGINREAVKTKAVERGLISPDANLSDKDIFHLILVPGFSTAREVTSVSGRGVGMDAVKRQIDTLRGSLALTSEEGKGTQILITLPLTLAIIDGLLVQVGFDQFIIPMSAVTENVELHRAQRLEKNGRNVIAVRGELVPYIDLRNICESQGETPTIAKIVIVRKEDQRVGLVVDSVLGTHQTVIQSLGKVFRNVNVVSGATIMGDGRVALIFDVAAIVRHIERECGKVRGSNWAESSSLAESPFSARRELATV